MKGATLSPEAKSAFAEHSNYLAATGAGFEKFNKNVSVVLWNRYQTLKMLSGIKPPNNQKENEVENETVTQGTTTWSTFESAPEATEEVAKPNGYRLWLEKFLPERFDDTYLLVEGDFNFDFDKSDDYYDPKSIWTLVERKDNGHRWIQTGNYEGKKYFIIGKFICGNRWSKGERVHVKNFNEFQNEESDDE